MSDSKGSLKSTFWNGVIPENPVFRLVLGMCPTLAVTKNAVQGVSMGIAAMAVLVFSNLFVSLLRNIIQEKIRIPAFIVIIASFVTIVQLTIKAFLPSLDESLGIYIPLIVVNCIIFARAEAYAFHHPPLHAITDGLGMGVGFTFATTLLASIRELLSHGTVFGVRLFPETFPGISIFDKAPGGFIVLGLLIIAVNMVTGYIHKRNLLKAEG